MKIEIKPSIAKGVIAAPPSKSFAHRFLICGALSHAQSKVHGISESDDMKATIGCLSSLGAKVQREGDTVTIFGGQNPQKEVTLDCIESGSTLRFMIPVALASGAEKITFKGSERLVARGVEVYEQTFENRGITFEKGKDYITVKGQLESGKYVLRGDVSSQYVSGLMFALPLLDGDSEIRVKEPVESRAYIDMTIAVLKEVGVDIVEKEKNVFFVKGNQKYLGGKYTVEGDWSNAAMLLALGEIGGEASVCGLDENSVQGDKICKEIFKKLGENDPVVDLANCPDLAPICFVVAALKNGAKFTGTRRLKIKESDRATAMAQELGKFGIDVEVYENEVVVHKNEIKTPCCEICGHNDHRIVMACSVLLSRTGGYINGAEAVKKSFPNFFEKLGELGVKYEIE